MNYYGRDKDIQLKVGILTLLTVVILFFGYGWLRERFSRQNYTEVKVMFATAGNIEVGNAVTVYGVKRGRVNDITLTREGVLTTLLLTLDFPLTTDSRFVIVDSNIMGSRQVDIIPGSGSGYISEGYIAQGESSSSLSAMIQKMDAVIGEIANLVGVLASEQELPQLIVQTIEATNSIAVRTDRMLEVNEREINSAINGFREAANSLNELLAANRDTITEIVDNTSGAVERIDQTFSRLEKAIASLEPFIELLATEEGTLQKMVSEDDLYEKLSTTTGRIDSLLVDIKKNPRRYFKFSIF